MGSAACGLSGGWHMRVQHGVTIQKSIITMRFIVILLFSDQPCVAFFVVTERFECKKLSVVLFGCET
jgi:hypothetical protein